MSFKCIFCGGDRGISFSVREKEYYRCSECEGVFMAPKSRLSPEKQKERYLKHNNTLENSGYVDFLRSFIEPVLGFIKQQRCDDTERANMRILDYGSGPEPVLVELWEAYRKEGVLYSDYGIRNFEIRGWDPFFAPETQFFEGGADLVVEILLLKGAAPLADLVDIRVHGDDGPALERLCAALAEPRHGLGVRPHAVVGELHECVEARVVSVDV